MDRVGRLWAILPCALGLSVAFFVLAPTHDLDARVGWFIGATLGLALANGVGSGVLLTLDPTSRIRGIGGVPGRVAVHHRLGRRGPASRVHRGHGGGLTLGRRRRPRRAGPRVCRMLGWFVPRTVASRPGREPVLDES